ncbi:MAG: 1-deoxy-D-xylulose-5-phosphate synthase [Clostridiales bacterium]|jgi:1-deoxy-D-xylulose-5-phosphate synthase|nr:1-deoxy-D-xylulose-5-phosphate synthase [Clostridiales bacterium]
MKYLENIHSPRDLQGMGPAQLDALAAEIREKILSCVSETEGHLASNLGMVEATIALHRVFDSPRDSILFDVGHQAYAHKLLTGRYEAFDTIRQFGGISGFTNREESAHDVLTAGHSGSALPAALGIARAAIMEGSDRYAIAVVGDGSFTNGMVYETLNCCADEGVRLIVLLNDNEMSISKNVGSMSRHFSRLRTSRRYFSFKRQLQAALRKLPYIGEGLIMVAYHIKEFFKRHIMKTNLFENMGLYYLGPVDGNDEKKIELLLREAKTKDRCTLIHMITLKGKGYAPAEEHPAQYHFAGGFDPAKGVCTPRGRTFSSVFGSHLCALALDNPHIAAVTAAMDKGTGLTNFKYMFPDRFFDMGIAEEAAATFAAGLAIGGGVPVYAVYSTFLQRAFDQLCEDVAMQNIHAVIAIDRAGIVPGDGITHQGVYDVSLLSSIPGVTLYAPETYEELKTCLKRCVYGEGLCALRYPKGEEISYDRTRFAPADQDIAIWDADSAADAVILTYGRLTGHAVAAAQQLAGTCKVRVVKLLRLLPLELEKIAALCENASLVYVLEEGVRSGGVGEAVAAYFARRPEMPPVHIRCVEGFLPHGDLESLFRLCGFLPEQIAAEISVVLQD